MFYHSETSRFAAVKNVRNQRSELHFGETIVHAKGPIARETWRLDNIDGVSSAAYSAENRAGTRVAKFTEPITGYDVTFAFEKLVQDGIWQLQTRPLRGNPDPRLHRSRWRKSPAIAPDRTSSCSPTRTISRRPRAASTRSTSTRTSRFPIC